MHLEDNYLVGLLQSQLYNMFITKTRKASCTQINQEIGNDLYHLQFPKTEIYRKMLHFNQIQFSSVAQSCPTFCNPMNRSAPGLPVHHQLPEFTQTHVHRVGDAIQPSHPLSSPSPPAPNPSQHHSLFQ